MTQYDEKIILEKFNEIKHDAINHLKKDGKIPSFALTEKEMNMINEGEKLGYRLHIEHKGDNVRIPIVKMRF